MIIKMGATVGEMSDETKQVIHQLKKREFTYEFLGGERTMIGAIGAVTENDREFFKTMSGVEEVVALSAQSWKLMSREFHPEDTIVKVGDIQIGGSGLVIMAGPCMVERIDWLKEIAQGVHDIGALILRGGVWKPRGSRYNEQGFGEKALQMLCNARDAVGIPFATEVMSREQLKLALQYNADIVWVGSRNMESTELLKAVGQAGIPVMLKRHMTCKLTKLLSKAEYIVGEGNKQLILCLRGIETGREEGMRFTPDVMDIMELKQETHYPVLFDPSHATGDVRYVSRAACMAVLGGADGLVVEVHTHRGETECDGAQSLTLKMFSDLVRAVTEVAATSQVNRTVLLPS